MTDRTGEEDQAAREAADWAARLNSRAVETHAVEEFYKWRKVPANAAAYARIEKFWDESGKLGEDRGIALAVRDALERPRWRIRLRSWFAPIQQRPAIMALALLMVVGLTSLLVSRMPTTYETAIGEQRLIRLDDGSRVRINTDSKLRVRLTDDRRRIELVRGQAFFEVAHDPARPFIVSADGAEVRAVGTRFDVHRTDGDVLVLLAEGMVRVRDRDAENRTGVLLTPGQAIWVGPGRSPKPETIDVEAATSWTSGHLTFRDTPLREAITEINRYSSHGIDLDDGDMAAVRVNGVFETGDVKAFVTAVTTLFPLRAMPAANGRTRLVGRS
jgi:transmembrane sensor